MPPRNLDDCADTIIDDADRISNNSAPEAQPILTIPGAFHAAIVPRVIKVTMYPIVELPELAHIQHQQDETEMYLGRENRCEGSGTLYVDESRLVWWSASAQKGWAIEYPSIMCHATCKETGEGGFPHACIYCHLDTGDEVGMEETDDLDEEEREQEEENTDAVLPSEVRFVPADKTSLDTIFRAMSDCQALHPDEEEEYSDEEAEFGDEDMFYTADNLHELEAHLASNPEAAARMAHLERVFNMPSGEDFENMVNGKNGAVEVAEEEIYEDAD